MPQAVAQALRATAAEVPDETLSEALHMLADAGAADRDNPLRLIVERVQAPHAVSLSMARMRRAGRA